MTDLKRAAETPEPDRSTEVVETVADLASRLTGTNWARFVENQISLWAASYFDEGQAFWTSPWQDLSPWAAWREEAALDRTPEVAGLAGFRSVVSQLPESANEAAKTVVDGLGLTSAELPVYLHRCLMGMAGWAAYGRYKVWDAELYGNTDATLSELLTIRLAFELAVLKAHEDQGIQAAFSEAKKAFVDPSLESEVDRALQQDLLLQDAFEKSLQRDLLSKFPAESSTEGQAHTKERAPVQAAFCIDVRSEVFRRSLEVVDPAVETIGFAGFFGFPIEYIPLGEERGGSQCPVLLTPQFTVEQTVRGADAETRDSVVRQRDLRHKLAKAWRSFKFGAVACFGFVGPVGLAYARKLVTDSMGWSRPVPTPTTAGFDESVHSRLGPTLEPCTKHGRDVGMTPEQRLTMAEGVLKAMSMTDDFARIVLLAGHGSTTVNNPHATGLDCGACGGHTGEANARVAAAVLNDAHVRAGLAERGLQVPEDTIFLAGQHDTCTDEIALYDLDQVPASHAEDLARLKDKLAAAGQLARSERARLLSLDPSLPLDAAVIGRSRDWSQVRPEWGLAGCYAFIAAPRHRTRSLDLKGRSFLHSYAWEQDEGYGVLELIMTAPMVVASWISLQYYGSTVDNRAFGSGNKVLHNVSGTVGVLEGNGGDLRVGLPWQSVHDGSRYIHEPARLNVMIEAPIEAMNGIIEKHEGVRQLLDHGWLYLYAIDAEGKVSHRYDRDLKWKSVDPKAASLAAA